MKVKKYRAESLRQALEQIKSELGEDALILNTKKVHTNGLFGIGAKDQVEVTVTADTEAVHATIKAKADSHQQQVKGTKLNLTDGEAATPTVQKEESNVLRSLPFLSALAARAKSSDTNDFSTVVAPKISSPKFVNEKIEIAQTAPRIVHKPKQKIAVQQKPVAPAPPPPRVSNKQPDKPSVAQNKTFTNELDRLRAELREMKFSLSSIVAQQSSQSNNGWNGFEGSDSFSRVFDAPFNEIYLELVNAGLSQEQACCIVEASLPLFSNEKMPAQNLSRLCLSKVLPSLVDFSQDPLQSLQPTVMALIGPTGVGKTTTIAKLAARVALRARRRVELLTLDTYRIAAVDQLKTYAEIIGVGCHVARSVLELNALVRRFSSNSTILIDTAGRGPNDLADHLELADYLRSNDDIIKSLVLSATTNPADAIVAAHKYSIFGVNKLVITKLDETIRPGAMIGWANETKLPLLYLCAGQRVPEDLDSATSENCAARIARVQFQYAAAA